MTRRRVAIAAALLFLITIYGFAQWSEARAPLHRDEVEYLHAAWRMGHGERLFVDFIEHHSPLFFAILLPLVPRGDTIPETETYVAHARMLFAVWTAIAIAAAALVVWRAAGNVWPAIVFVALMFSAGPVWRNGLGDVRSEGPGLALFWSGAVLLLDVFPSRRRAFLHGLGIGLVFLAAIVNPKWPLSSIVLGIVFLMGLRRRDWHVSIGTAVASGLLTIAALLPFTDLRRFVFFVFMLSARVTALVKAHSYEPSNFWGCPPFYRPLAVLPAVLLVLLAMRIPAMYARSRLVALFAALGAASLIEIRFIYPWTAVDFRYYVFWVVIASAFLALAPFAAAALIRTYTRFQWIAAAIPVVAILLTLVDATSIIVPAMPARDSYWMTAEWMRKRLGPGETIWISALRHPIGMRDASYYWFGYADLVPTAIAMRADPKTPYLPPITEADLPPCRIERGLDPNARFIAGDAPEFYLLPKVNACFERLRAQGRVTKTLVPVVWYVRPAAAATIAPPQR